MKKWIGSALVMSALAGCTTLPGQLTTSRYVDPFADLDVSEPSVELVETVPNEDESPL